MNHRKSKSAKGGYSLTDKKREKILYDPKTGISVHYLDNTPETKSVELTLPKYWWEIIQIRAAHHHGGDIQKCLQETFFTGASSIVNTCIEAISDGPPEDPNKWN